MECPACHLSEPKRDEKTGPPSIRLARYYQSLLDSGKFESRAALDRYLGVSRARVTQVLNRLITANVSAAEIAPLDATPHSAVG